jgi:predicted naringenin-chalcone synthase
MDRTIAHILGIGTAIPPQDIHRAFIDWAGSRLTQPRDRALFERMAARSGIEHRWSVLPPAPNGGSPVEPGGFYHGDRLPSTARRMEVYAQEAPELALAAIEDLARQADVIHLTHLVVASCTGFVAPGIDQIIIERMGLSTSIERTFVGFMGCYAAVAALRTAHHIVRSEPRARVLVVNVELSSLHLNSRYDIQSLLAALQFGDGAAAALVAAEPQGLALDRFFCTTLAQSEDLIQWAIADEGFVMTLSGEVPRQITKALRGAQVRDTLLGRRAAPEFDWAVHPGGRSVLDAVESALELSPMALQASRSILARFGNMSSASLMFVLAELMANPSANPGVAMAFGPGIAVEGFCFEHASPGVGVTREPALAGVEC